MSTTSSPTVTSSRNLLLLAALPFTLWAIYRLATGPFRWEMAALAVVMPAAAWFAATRKLFLGLYPFAAVGVVYDAMGLIKNFGLTTERVHLCDLRELEMRLFGVTSGGERMTLNDFFQIHHAPVVDMICAIPYGGFIFFVIGYSIFLYFTNFTAMRMLGWSFFILNIAGFITYHILPAAPPWYYHAHGCLVDLTAHSSAGPNLTRVDGWLGVDYFTGMYGRSSDVFGAIPSLHVAYPLLMFYLSFYARAGALGKSLAGLFTCLMVFSAIYLDHHWCIDVILGLLYCTTVFFAVRAWFSPGAPARLESLSLASSTSEVQS